MRLNLADDVLAREVLSLLAYHGATGPLDASAVGDGEYLLDLLARSADADLASPQASDVVENESVRIGPYRTIREIGRGGMGTVYLAVRDDGQFRQEVALKLLRGSIATDDFVRRFRCERQILAGIEHPNIARLVDGGRTTDGLPYFVMEYIDGTPVDTFCDTHELDTRERVRLVRKVCSAVQLAHQNFVIHRGFEAREYPSHPGRRTEAPRLRDRKGAGRTRDRRRYERDETRHTAHDAGLREPRADPRREHHDSQ